jgi:hypothetical protein
MDFLRNDPTCQFCVRGYVSTCHPSPQLNLCAAFTLLNASSSTAGRGRPEAQKQIRLLVSNHPSPLDEQTEANLTVSLNLKAVQGAQGKMVRPSSSSRLDRRLKSEMLIVS